ncbi:MAG: hypothetical protein DWQ08_13175 [Proteobacteria bacterium]|nr:MAG: hypothetical protein DWQ08_13175 [Pseudomonadota bacterium]
MPFLARDSEVRAVDEQRFGNDPDRVAFEQYPQQEFPVFIALTRRKAAEVADSSRRDKQVLH